MKISRKTKRGLGFAFATISIIIFLKELYSDEDALPSAEDPSFAPKYENSLFFVETSYNGQLTARKACAVEAAARAHPKREIYVLFSAPVTDYKLETTCLAKLLHFPNVKFLRVHIAEFSKGTAVHSILLNDLKKSRFPIQHTADILRILTLYKWGGISLDTDMVVMTPLDDMPNLNWIVQRDRKFVAPGLFSFSQDIVGNNLTGSILAEILKTYNPNDRSITGSSVIKKVVQRMCPLRIRWDACKGIGIYSHKFFYCKKIHLNEFNKIMRRKDCYSFQWDFHSTRRRTTGMPKEQLAKKFCPSIYWSHREELLGV